MLVSWSDVFCAGERMKLIAANAKIASSPATQKATVAEKVRSSPAATGPMIPASCQAVAFIATALASAGAGTRLGASDEPAGTDEGARRAEHHEHDEDRPDVVSLEER